MIIDEEKRDFWNVLLPYSTLIFPETSLRIRNRITLTSEFFSAVIISTIDIMTQRKIPKVK